MRKKLLFVILMIFISTMAMAATHTVKKGESLAIIAKKYGVTVDEIVKKNNIKNPNKVAVGTRLTIPPKTTKYRVQKGDNLTKIATKYNTTVDAIRKANGLKSNSTIKVGEILIIPRGTSVATTQPKTTTTKPSTTTQPKTQPKSTTTQPKKTPAPAVNEKVPYFWPAEGERAPLEGKLKGTMITTGKNSVVHSVSTGKVIYEGQYRGLGRVIIVESAGGYTYIYGGNDDTMVNVGDKVVPGTEIGVPIANMETGKTVVYFCVYRDGVPVDERKAPRA